MKKQAKSSKASTKNNLSSLDEKPKQMVSKNSDPQSSTGDGKDLKSDEEYAAAFNLSVQDVRDIRDLFNSIDSDGGGEIDAPELQSLLSSLGRKVSDKQAKEMIDRVDKDGTGTVGFEEFLVLIADEAVKEKSKDPMLEARKTFAMFDKDNSGSIDIKELKQALIAMGQTVSEDDLKQMMKDADEDGTGEIDFEEFCALIGVKVDRVEPSKKKAPREY
jgi:calmodulin